MIKAEIVADSVNEFNNRITTMVVTFPRIILAELNTHRMFSRNSASSRAIPFDKMVEVIKTNPFIPIAWQKDHSGMQGTQYITSSDEIEPRINDWLDARNDAVKRASYLSEMGITKQICNRLLEPFMWTTVVITATEWENFFALRCPQYGGKESALKREAYFRSKKDCVEALENAGVNTFNISLDDTLGWLKINKGQAEIHMMALAEAMWDAFNESIPKELKAGEWHIPGLNIIED